MKNIIEIFSSNLVSVRRLRKFSQHSLSEASKVSESQIVKIESGEVAPNIDTVGRLASALNVKPFLLFIEDLNPDFINGINSISSDLMQKETVAKQLFFEILSEVSHGNKKS